MPDTVMLPQLSLRAMLRADSFDQDTNSIELVWSTGAAVLRYDWDGPYLESLDMSAKAVRLDRMNAGASFLNSHSSWDLADVIGRVMPGSASVDGKQGVCRVKLSSDPAKAGIVTDIRGGVIGNVSVGYIVYEMIRTEASADAVASCRVTDWEPFEVSAVPVPADFMAQTRAARGAPTTDRGEMHPCRIMREAPAVAPPTAQVEPPAPLIASSAIAAAQARRRLLNKLAGL